MDNFELAKKYFLEGCIYLEAEDFYQAEFEFKKSLELIPNRPSTLTNISATQLKLKKYSDARIAAHKAIAIDECNYEAYLNLGLIENELKLYENALKFFDQAISINPQYAEAWSNKGNALQELKRFEESISHHDQAISINPQYAEAWSNKGNALQELKLFEEAVACYERALSLKPNVYWVRGELLHTKMKICSWSGLENLLSDIEKKALTMERVSQPFPLLAISDDPLLHKKISEIYIRSKLPPKSSLGSILESPKSQKIRIGYFSSDFKNHPVSLLTAELYEMHNRAIFEVYAFSLQRTSSLDRTNQHLRKIFDKFLDVDDISDIDVAKLARQLKIDIAVDLTGCTQGSRPEIFFHRCAPIQVAWLGYPGTMGLNLFDYIVVDKTIIPESHQIYFSEKMVYLPNSFMVDDSKRKASARLFSRNECGLPEGAFVFCCFNSDYKIIPQVLRSWARILHGADGSVLWLAENNDLSRENLLAEFQKCGISPQRIFFAKRLESIGDYLARFSVADLFLDTHPYNAHTIAVDCLKSGLPVVTLMGKSFASRVAASLLNSIGMHELVTHSLCEYEKLAIELATNPKKLSDVKFRLADNLMIAPFLNTPLFAKNLEDAYVRMYDRYHQGLRPVNMYI